MPPVCPCAWAQTAPASWVAPTTPTPLTRNPPAVAPRSLAINTEEILVLTNGEIFEGRVSREADQIAIQTPQGSRLVFSADRVDFICNSLEEAYWEKYSRLGATDIGRQVDLFQWCLKQQLLSCAENQLQLLMQSRISAVDLDHLNRQLHVARAEQTTLLPAHPAAESAGPEPAPEIVHRLPGWGDELPVTQAPAVVTSDWSPPATGVSATGQIPAVDQAGYTEVVDAAAELPDSQQMQKLMRDLPGGMVGNFRRRVEPLLKRNCSSCHRQTTEPVLEFGGGQWTNALPLSQRNLYRLLPYLAGPEVVASPLWRACTEPHGGQAEPILTGNSREAQAIFQWLAESLPVTASFAAPTDTEPASAPLARPRPDALTRPEAPQPSIADIPQLRRAELNDLPPLQEDPYDPAVFNRQHHR